MESKFFKIVRWISLSFATLAIVVIVLGALKAASEISSSADTIVKEPKMMFSDIQKEVQEESPEVDSPETTADMNYVEGAKTEETEFDKNFNKDFEIIKNNLIKYTQITEQQEVNEDGLRKYMINNISDYNEDLQMSYTKQLAGQTNVLVNYGTTQKNNNAKALGWPQFVEGFTKQYRTKIADEHDRIESEQAAAMMDKASALITIYAIGAAALVFMFFTMMLVLLRIESNTRVKTI